MPKMLAACEMSGRVRDAFTARGWDAWSCDLLDSETPGQHIKGDVREALDYGWDLIIAFPPCTRLANSGVRWLQERNLWRQMADAAEFFQMFLAQATRCRHIAVENPIPHRYAVDLIGRKYDQIIQPWMFGHGETKATCLWLHGLPKLVPTQIVDGRYQRVHLEPPGPERATNRSRTFPGIARAMADQWGAYVERDLARYMTGKQCFTERDEDHIESDRD